jgi:hypothetical protein
MRKLIYGRNGHVRFSNEGEKREAFDYLRSSPNVIRVHEDNHEQGAWGPEERIHFRTLAGVPDGLLKNMTAGNGAVAGRINCKDLIEEVWGPSPTSRSSRPASASSTSTGGICCQIRAPHGSECMACGKAV